MIPLLDLKRIHAPINDELKATAARVVDETRYIMGSDVSEFEIAVAQYTGARHAIGCASGSDALLLALMALDLEPGDEVITTPYTFFSTVSSIERLGLKTVFADIEPGTFNIDPKAVEAAITPRTKAVIAVHLFGQMADMDALVPLCRDKGLFLIEDAAQALSAKWQGQMAGTLGDIGTYSFFPSKNLGGLGDAGMMVTGNDEYSEKMKVLRLHGMAVKYYHKWTGINSRLDTMQAALLNVKLPHLDGYSEARRENACKYHELLESFAVDASDEAFLNDSFKGVGLPVADDRAYHVYNQYVIRSSRREELRAALNNASIGNEVYYPVPLHLQECFSYLGYKPGDMPHSERAANTSLALPIFGGLTDEELATVATAIKEFHAA